MSEETTTGTAASPDRLAAHERLSTGALASWMRACASHPWKVMIAWLGIIAALIVLVATVGGSLKDEFEIPGSDTQRATDLIESEFASEQGGVLNLVFAAPEGQTLEDPELRAAVEEAVAKVQGDEFKPTGTDPDGTAGITSVGDPFSDQTFSDDRRIAYAEAQFDRVIYEEDREQVVAIQEAVRETVEPAGVTVEFNGDAEFPPIEQGTQELLGLLMALIVLLIVFRTIVATAIPLALAIVALMTAFLLLFILAGLTDINTITPLLVSMIGLGVGIDYSLFIVTRFRQYLHEGLTPRDAAAEAGASAGRATIFAGLTVAISVTGLAFFGLDFVTKLGIEDATDNITTTLIIAALLLALGLAALLFQWRTLLIALVTLPVSMVTAALVLDILGETFNAISFAGLAVALAVVIDDAVVGAENVARRLREKHAAKSDSSVADIVLEASREMRSPLTYATLIALLAVVPVAVMAGRPGAFFEPLALSYALAVGAAMLVALTLTPALSLVLHSWGSVEGRESPLLTRLAPRYKSVLGRVVGAPRAVVIGAGAAVLLAALAFALQDKSVDPDVQGQGRARQARRAAGDV